MSATEDLISNLDDIIYIGIMEFDDTLSDDKIHESERISEFNFYKQPPNKEFLQWLLLAYNNDNYIVSISFKSVGGFSINMSWFKEIIYTYSNTMDLVGK